MKIQLTLLFDPAPSFSTCCAEPITSIMANFEMAEVQLFPDLHAFWFLEKTALQENRVSGTVLMFQLMWNSPTSEYNS